MSGRDVLILAALILCGAFVDRSLDSIAALAATLVSAAVLIWCAVSFGEDGEEAERWTP